MQIVIKILRFILFVAFATAEFILEVALMLARRLKDFYR